MYDEHHLVSLSEVINYKLKVREYRALAAEARIDGQRIQMYLLRSVASCHFGQQARFAFRVRSNQHHGRPSKLRWYSHPCTTWGAGGACIPYEAGRFFARLV